MSCSPKAGDAQYVQYSLVYVVSNWKAKKCGKSSWLRLRGAVDATQGACYKTWESPTATGLIYESLLQIWKEKILNQMFFSCFTTCCI